MQTRLSQIRDDGEGIGRRFEASFTDWTEFFQHRFTHRDRTSLARLDRIYCSAPCIELDDLDMSAKFALDLASKRCSDHIPVAFSVRQKSKANSCFPTVPCWVVNHRLFAGFVKESMDDVDVDGDDTQPWFQLEALKESFFVAASRVKAATGAMTLSDEEQVYWGRMAARGVRNSTGRPIQRAIRALLALAQFFPQSIVVGETLVSLHASAGAEIVGSFDDIRYNDICEYVRKLSDHLASTREEAEAEDEKVNSRAKDKKIAHN